MRNIKKIKKSFSFFLLALYLLVSCSDATRERQQEFQNWVQKDEKIKILSTTSMINDIVKVIGGDHVKGLTLIQGDLDPHSYQLVKGDDEKLRMADVIFYNGLGLEHGPSLYHYLHNNTRAIPLGDRIEQNSPDSILFVQGQKDPHIWMDIALWSKIIPIIVDVLSTQDPQHASEYQANGINVQKDLFQAHANVKEIMHAIPENRRYLVTSHDAFNYFTRAYLSTDEELKLGGWEKRFAAPEGLAPESQLSTTNIRSIIDHMHQHNVQLLFPESNVSRDSIKKILQAGREQGLDLEIACCPLYADAMGPKGSDGDTYAKMVTYNANMIASYMKPNGERNKKEGLSKK